MNETAYREYLVATRRLLKASLIDGNQSLRPLNDDRSCFFEVVVTEASEFEWVSNFFLLDMSGIWSGGRL